ncbi:hypothetical protein [Dechloromonas sp. HYN0024]|uniref:hypothetical protein n=1 Tax=Dechloromonas sp. HYN0024 TaxID=2231055 RepID=UPI000E44491F|nr:hypothetical protein [Dechloromonas sp. HYN0024]AXS79735.1 hypothetical protein HYN24_06730 [Dechloromonas sp. HYN0024]
MSLDRYEPLFFNANFKESASTGALVAYRGELILEEGEVADANGRRKPPTEVLKQAVLLGDAGGLRLISGSLDELQQFPLVVEKFGADFNAGTIAVFFTVNIPKGFVTTANGASIAFIPLVQGMVWTELCDLVALDKGDFKGQSAADKVATVYGALKSYKFKYAEQSVEEALKTTNNAKRETHGAI